MKKRIHATRRISRSPECGRHLVAARDLAASELILRDAPAVVGPSRQQEHVVCVECFRWGEERRGQSEIHQTLRVVVGGFLLFCRGLMNLFFRRVSGDHRCEDCNFPLCGGGDGEYGRNGQKCCGISSSWHRRLECALLKVILHSDRQQNQTSQNHAQALFPSPVLLSLAGAECPILVKP